MMEKSRQFILTFTQPRAKALTLTILRALYLKDDSQKPHPLLGEVCLPKEPYKGAKRDL
jgi:hypothetical protein